MTAALRFWLALAVLAGCEPQVVVLGGLPEPEICDNEIDDDQDGWFDCHDFDCDENPICPELCRDGRDNDGDGFADCEDPQCDGICPEADACDDGRDNDGDLLVDCDDQDCFGHCSEVCGDGIDNDWDRLTDCRDPDCSVVCPEDCDDGEENDADGLVDCFDEECHTVCDVDADGYISVERGGDDCDDDDPTRNPGLDEICNGGKDDNCNGAADEADPTLIDATLYYDDSDGDGFGDFRTEAIYCDPPDDVVEDFTDCNDADGLVFPGAVEVCNGWDDDCDNLVDDDDLGVDPASQTTWYADDDGDGYGDALSTLVTCDTPEGYVLDDSDCNDSDPAAGPPEIWLVDADGDGFGAGPPVGSISCDAPSSGHAAQSKGLDCDDTEFVINPDAFEFCDDGTDQDCDGYDPPCGLSSADATLLGDGADDQAGFSVANAGDVDGDLVDDLWIGAYGSSGYAGAAYLLRGPVSGEVDLTAAHLVASGDASFDFAGWSVAGAGDVDGNGNADLLAGAYAAGLGGVTYLVRGPVSGALDLDVAPLRVYGEDIGDQAGFSVAGGGDLDGDLRADVLIGAPQDDEGGLAAGAAYVVRGDSVGDVDLSVAHAKLVGEEPDDWAGSVVASLPDTTGDGAADLAVGAFKHGAAGPQAGAVYLVEGPVAADLDLADADAKLTGELDFDNAGFSIASAGDVDDDGVHDLLVGAPFEGTTGVGAGAVYLVLGPIGSDLSLAGAHAKLLGASAGDNAGHAVSSAGDVNADGLDDLIIGPPHAGAVGNASVVLSPVAGVVSLADAPAVLVGEEVGAQAGAALATGDFDDDGAGDVLIGAPHQGGTGAVYTIYAGLP